jgi:hypothetical protein
MTTGDAMTLCQYSSQPESEAAPDQSIVVAIETLPECGPGKSKQLREIPRFSAHNRLLPRVVHPWTTVMVRGLDVSHTETRAGKAL